jgi:hypothetical protein
LRFNCLEMCLFLNHDSEILAHVCLLVDGHGSHINVDFMWECKQNNIQLCLLPPYTSHILQLLDLSCFGLDKQRYRADI